MRLSYFSAFWLRENYGAIILSCQLEAHFADETDAGGPMRVWLECGQELRTSVFNVCQTLEVKRIQKFTSQHKTLQKVFNHNIKTTFCGYNLKTL